MSCLLVTELPAVLICGMRIRMIVCLGVALSVSVTQAQDANEPNPDEWIIESYQIEVDVFLPDLEFHPSLPATDASEVEIRKFIQESSSFVSKHYDNRGYTFPPGSLFAYDPNTHTMAARLPRRLQETLRLDDEETRLGTARFIVYDLTIFEAPASTIRAMMEDACESANHQQLLKQLRSKATQNGEVRVVTSLGSEAKSGQRFQLFQAQEFLLPEYWAIDPSDVEYELISQSVGTRFESDPVVGADRELIDWNFSLEHHFAAPVRREETHSGVPIVLTSTSKALVDSSTTIKSGTARMIGVWSPRTGAKRNTESLQAAFLEASVVPIFPKPEPRVRQLLIRHGETVLKVPAQPPNYDELKRAVPIGMVEVRFRVPPGFANAETSARGVLEKNGITFPEGAMAKYKPTSSTLIVHNTPFNIDMVDAYVGGCGWGGLIKTLAIAVHLIEGPGELIRELKTSSRDSHRAVDWNELEKAVERKEARIIDSIWVESKSGQRSKLSAGEWRQHPSYAWIQTSEKNEEVEGNSREIEIDERLVGVQLEVDPVLNSDGQTFGLNFLFNYDYAPPFNPEEPKRDAKVERLLDFRATRFHRSGITMSTTMADGEYRMLGSWKPTGPPEFEDTNIVQAVVVRMDVIDAREGDHSTIQP